jgi:hypothetical protein
MADEMDAFFNSGIVPQAGKGGQQNSQGGPAADLEMDSFFKPQTQSAPQGDPMDEFFGAAPAAQAPQQIPLSEEQALPPGQLPVERPGYLEAYLRGVQRNYGQLQQLAPAARGSLAELEGDEETKAQAIGEIQQIESEMPQPIVGSLAEINNFDDFTYWLTEKFGEQSLTLASMAATGGLSALGANLVGRGMLLNAASRAALTKNVGMAGGYAGASALEAGGMATELVQATGDFHPELAVPGGLAAGALEIYTPLKFLKELPIEGIAKAGLRTAGREAATEMGQEQIAILARDYADPNYTYFSKPMVMRTLESGVAGAVVGGGVGTVVKAGTTALGLDGEAGDNRRTLTPEEIAAMPAPPPDTTNISEPEEPKESPVSWLRRKMMGRNVGSPDMIPDDPRAAEDIIEQAPLLKGIKKKWQKAGAAERQMRDIANLVDDTTERYVIMDSGGNTGNRVLSSTGLEEALAMRPAEEFQPRIVKVDQQSMQPGAITAELFDLPDSKSSRLYFAGKRMFFLPGVRPQEQAELKARYDVLVDKINSKPWQLEVLDELRMSGLAELQAEYEALVNKGLRVIPTPGANFHYNGVVEGESVNQVPKSGRTTQIAQLSPDGIFSVFAEPDRSFGDYGPAGPKDEQYIALDRNKIKDEDIDILSPEGSAEGLRFRVKPGKQLAKGAIVRGLPRPGMLERESGPQMKAYTRDYDAIQTNTDGRVYTNLELHRVPREVQETVEQLVDALRDLKPVLHGLYKRLGVKNPPNIFIHYDGLSSFASPAQNEIGLSAQAFMKDQWSYLHASPDLRTALLVTLFHELGHLVTLRSWGKLPAAVMEQAHIGYQRALLKFRISGATEHIGLPIGTFTSTDRQVDYNLTFIEYLAETFRRWAFSDARILTDLDKFYKDGGKLLQRLKQEAVNTVGAAKAEDLYRANFSFNQVMEYLEHAAGMGLRPVQMMAKAFQAGQYPQPITLAKARMIIEGELARFRQLLTADMNVEISNETDVRRTPSGSLMTRFGTMDSYTRTLRILAGSVAMMGEKSAATRTIVHEAFHGVQDMLTVAEAQVLVEAAKREKVLKPSELAQYVRDTNQWLDENNVTDPVQRQELLTYTIETELMAALVESRANGRQFESIVSKILDQILGAVERIVNGLRGLGYNSTEDVIRLFYRGELTRRYDTGQMFEYRASILDRLIGAYKDWKFKGEPTTVGSSNLPVSMTAADKFRLDDSERRGEVASPDTLPVPTNQNEKGKYAQAVADQKFKKPEQSSVAEIPPRPMLGDAETVQLDATTNIKLVESKDPTGKVKLATYVAETPEGELKAWAEVSHNEDGYHVDNVYVARKYYREALPMKIYKLVEQRMGETPKPNGTLTKAGYRALLKINPMLVSDYVFDSSMDMWISPYQLQTSLTMYKALQVREKRMGRLDMAQAYGATVERLKGLQKELKVPKTGPVMAMDREFQILTQGQVQEQNERELVDAVTGSESARPDPFDQLQDQQEAKEIRNAAKILGLPENMVAPTQAENILMNGIIDKMRRSPENDPSVNRYLSGVSAEMDRISWFSKIFFGLHQLIWRNEHLSQAKNYLALVEQMNSRIMGWISRADDVGKAWDKLPEIQRNLLSEYMFWLTEMEYLSASERAANVVRHPTAQERSQYITQNRLAPNTVAVGQRVEQEFADYLSEVERVSREHAQRTITDPQALQAELNRIAAEMNAMRAKPYFPMTRFGEFTISVRDPQQNGRVVAFYAYPTVRELKAAVRQVHAQWPLMELQTGKVPEEAQEFMGLPAALLRIIKANLNLNPAQARWLEEFELLMAPERSFRKRWLSRKGTPGYSLDGIRVFAQYFRSGARYLGRIEYKDLMKEQIDSLQGTVKTLRDGTRRAMIVDYMQRHLNYLMEGGRDWGKLKSMISIFQLGGSVAAAGMNLTQVPLATYPYLAGLFGDAQTLRALKRNADVLRPTFGIPARGSADYLAARDEAVAQGKIEAGQAIDLGAFAEYDNLNRSYAGTAAQRAYRKLGYWSMILFSRSEQFNREWSFKTAYELALDNKNSKHFQDTAVTYASEILEISARRGLTIDQATAFMVARRAVDQTQLVFQPWARPTFLRSGFASTLQIFFSYTQGMLYLLGNSPGAKRMWFGLLAMYGLAGLPGSEDLDRIIRLLARKFMGKDFSPQLEARKMIREMTRGTVFDQVGPDLAMHGISRYSMVGVGLLPEGYGVPRFDASASGSMGQIVPGLSEALRAAANNANWKDMTADIARDVAGAGFGQIFAMMQFLTSDPFSADLKKWEKVFPRSVKAASKAYRYATEGREVTNQGGTLAQFDMRDPDDIATVVAQALGFTPEKVSEKWGMIRATQDIALWYETRKMALYAQLDVAIRNHETDDQKAVIERMVSLNKELSKQGWGAMSIQVQPVVNSLRQRARVRALQEGNLPAKTSQIPLTKQMLDLYPGMMQEIERKKVK